MSQSQVKPKQVPGRSVRGDVYYNLNCGGLSVVDRQSGSDMYGHVIAHAEQAWITDAEVVTYESKREKALAEGCKNVHAMFRGEVQTYGDFTLDRSVDPVEIHYHVDKEGCFYDRQGRRLVEAEDIIIKGKQIQALHPTFE